MNNKRININNSEDYDPKSREVLYWDSEIDEIIMLNRVGEKMIVIGPTQWQRELDYIFVLYNCEWMGLLSAADETGNPGDTSFQIPRIKIRVFVPHLPILLHCLNCEKEQSTPLGKTTIEVIWDWDMLEPEYGPEWAILELTPSIYSDLNEVQGDELVELIGQVSEQDMVEAFRALCGAWQRDILFWFNKMVRLSF